MFNIVKSKKRRTVVVLVFFLFLASIIPAFAVEKDKNGWENLSPKVDKPQYPGGIPDGSDKPTYTGGTPEGQKNGWEGLYYQGGESTGGGMGYYISYLLSLPIRGIANAILGASGATGFYSIEELVFSDGDGSPNATYVFTESEWEKIVMPWYKLMLTIASMGAIYQMAVLWIGYYTIAGSINPQKMVSAKETAWNMILVMLFMTQVPALAKHIFEANAVFVGAIKNTLQSKGLYDTAIRGISASLLESTNNPLLDSLAMLAFAGLMLSLNFLYMVRKFVLGVLITISPMVAWAWLTQKKTPVLLMLSEIVSNGFMSLSHAIVLAFYASMVTYSGDGMFSTWWAKLFAISLLIPVSALLRRLITGWLNLIGIDEERYAKIANSGLGGLFATATIISGAVGGASGLGQRKPVTTGPDVSTPSLGGTDGAAGFGTKVSSSINAFSAASGKDTAIQNAGSWMTSKSKDAKNIDVKGEGAVYDNLSSIGSNFMNEREWKETPPIGASIESSDGFELSSGEEKSNVHFTIPDPSIKVNEEETTLGVVGVGGIKPKTEVYGSKLPKGHEVPPTKTQDGEINIKKDNNTFLGPVGNSTKTYFGENSEPTFIQIEDKSVSAMSKVKENKNEQVRKWPTLEKTAETYNKVLPTVSVIGAVYGGVAGTAFGLSSGMPKSYQMAGMGLGRQAVHDIGYVLNKANNKVNQKKSGSNLDKPSLR